MASVSTKQENLEKLVEELLRAQPNEQMVKKLSLKLGISYSADPLILMNTVLQSMNNVYLTEQRRKNLESQVP